MVGGESAGGRLAVAVCMMARARGIRVSFQMPLYPMISNPDTESSRDNHGRVWNTRGNHLGWRMYLRGAATKRTSCSSGKPDGLFHFSALLYLRGRW
ncbi:MAG: alpha/beta hydrolase fold domain-containing protein [Clostridia bacterium]|nr:alpha/beta hydrolase fold domain-containing protein [Clostridia bacterium]